MPYIDSEILEKLITTMVDGFARIEKKLERMNRQKECLDGDTLLDNVGPGRTARSVATHAGALPRERADTLLQHERQRQEFLSCFRDTGVPETEGKMTLNTEPLCLLLLFILVAIGI